MVEQYLSVHQLSFGKLVWSDETGEATPLREIDLGNPPLIEGVA